MAGEATHPDLINGSLVGILSELEQDKTFLKLAAGDIVVLATDGAWEPLGDDLAGILACNGPATEGGLRAAAARICRAAVERGGDNASVVLVAVG